MLLLIPGPVTTRPEIRAAAGQDYAPWDRDFRPLYAAVREAVGALAGGVLDTHAVLPLQGAGHFAIEASLRSLVPPAGRILIPLTGSYGERMARLAGAIGRAVVPLAVSPTAPLAAEAVARALAADAAITHVGLVYSETSTGVVHDPVAIGAAVRAAGRRMILDAVSAFGALPLDLTRQPETDAAVFTANKCLEGLPGLAVVIARKDTLTATAPGQAASWSFDLRDIFDAGERDGWGSFRFTPPAQIVAALRTALVLLAAEGGAPARLARYRENARVLYDGMVDIGLRPCLARGVQGPIVVNVAAPGDPRWSLQGFVDALKTRGFLISNFYNTARPSFRVGCIGAVAADDMRRFVRAADMALHALDIRNRAPSD
ncbi:MAG: 2-aminoethylphosphonate--pyruvate transaminase [Rhodospirillales bacterium]|nr:2-aminoethylphosphonate--pyruvate transaminase [Rhodospirillales bacterium]